MELPWQSYPQNYKAKEHIKNELKNYNIIDDASSALNVTRTLIKTITITLTIFSIISLILMLICYVIWCLMQHIKYIMFTPILVLLIFIRYDKEAKKSLDGNLVDVLLNDKILTLICILYGIIIISLLELYL